MPLYKAGFSKYQPITDWAPDADPRTPGILLDMDGAMPVTAGYRSRPSPVVFNPTPLPARPIGAYLAMYSDNSLALWVGTPEHLYRMDFSNTWTEVDNTLLGFHIQPTALGTYPRWRFAQFNNYVIAVNPGVPDAYVAAGANGTFAAVGGGSPSFMSTVISVGGVVVGYKAESWANSAAGTYNNWTPDVQTQAATGVLYDYPGSIVAASPFFRTQIVWKAASMYILTFVGADTIWQNQLASNATGTWGQECVAQTSEAVYFIGNDDFYMTQGYAPQRVPNQVKGWFFRNVYRDADNNPSFLDQTWSWYDTDNAVIYWHFVSKAAPQPSEMTDRYLSYNVRSQRWGTGYLSVRCLVPDSQPGRSAGFYFDENNLLNTWTGTPGSMRLLTGFVGDDSRLSQLMRARAGYSDGLFPSSDAITPRYTNVLGQPPTVGPPYIEGADGWANGRNYSRYHQLNLTTVGDTEVTGFAGEFRVGGNR